MGTGAIAWACLLLAIHQAPVQEFHLNSRKVGLPLTAKDNVQNDARQLILNVSEDRGETWQQAGVKKPGEENMFRFTAPHDGRYWFIVQRVERDGRTTPSSLVRAKINMAVVVDTVPPKVKVTAERLPGGAVEARWSINEEAPDAPSVRLDYHTDATPPGGEWSHLADPSGRFSLQGKHSFDPGNAGKTGEVRVRVQMKDQAGNVGEDVFVLPAVGVSSSASPVGPAETPTFGVIPTVRNEPTAPINRLSSRQTTRPVVDAALPGPASGGVPLPMTPPAELHTPGSLPNSGLPLAASSAERMPPGAATDNSSGALPKVQIVNKRELRLDFTVAKVGPSGLGAADVYVTLDKGASWQKLPKEVAISLPAGADLHGSESVRGSVSVQLPAEGTTYGFIVAVKSKAGLAPPPPKAGDPPEVLVELDTTVPKAQMYKPAPDPTQPNTLLLSWNAVDRNLAENPVTLEWAEHQEGPWKGIGGGPLPNSGQYPWHLTEPMPSRVFLRLTVRDVAGNEARAQTDKPELIDLSVPQTKLIGVAPGIR